MHIDLHSRNNIFLNKTFTLVNTHGDAVMNRILVRLGEKLGGTYLNTPKPFDVELCVMADGDHLTDEIRERLVEYRQEKPRVTRCNRVVCLLGVRSLFSSLVTYSQAIQEIQKEFEEGVPFELTWH